MDATHRKTKKFKVIKLLGGKLEVCSSFPWQGHNTPLVAGSSSSHAFQAALCLLQCSLMLSKLLLSLMQSMQTGED